MTRKKVVLFIVEGITDKESLELLLVNLIKNDNQVIFELVHGDITADYNINTSNIKKQQLLNILSSTTKVYNSIPYRIFYFSSNLEHVLHDKIDVDENLKMEYAESFLERYEYDTEGFIEFMCNNEFTVDSDYRESWNFIKRDNNSIKRYSNFNIVLKDYSQQNIILLPI